MNVNNFLAFRASMFSAHLCYRSLAQFSHTTSHMRAVISVICTIFVLDEGLDVEDVDLDEVVDVDVEDADLDLDLD